VPLERRGLLSGRPASQDASADAAGFDHAEHFALVEKNDPRIDLIARDLPGACPPKDGPGRDAQPVGNGLGLADSAPRQAVKWSSHRCDCSRRNLSTRQLV